MNATLKNECLRAAFKLQKHRMEHALSVDPYRLYCVFGISSLEQDDGLIGHPFMSQYPEAASLKLFEAIEATTFCDDVFDAPVQSFSDSIYPAYMLSIQNVFDVPIDSVSGDGDLFNCLHPYVRKLISTGLFPEFSILTRLSGKSGCHKGCWGSCSFSSSCLLRAGLATPCFLCNNSMPTYIVHKNKEDLLPMKSKLVGARTTDHMKITRKRTVT